MGVEVPVPFDGRRVCQTPGHRRSRPVEIQVVATARTAGYACRVWLDTDTTDAILVSAVRTPRSGCWMRCGALIQAATHPAPESPHRPRSRTLVFDQYDDLGERQLADHPRRAAGNAS
ncbi:hypothetical protein KRMM14A1259_71590 [Krasilnikovia sp. MM14-A1259]